ncbi:MAG TPA: AraC family transcriptional regulator [Streptosporangiaceae bacterium]|jgi:AraC-like DNA-binding protein
MELVTEAADPETAGHLLSGTYGPMRIDVRSQRYGMRLAQASLGPVRFDHVRFAMDFTADAAPLSALAFGQLLSGRVSYRSDGSQREYHPGQVFLVAQPDHPYTVTVHDAELQLVVFGPALPSQVAAPAPGRAQHPVRFTGYEPVSPQAADDWITTCAYIRGTLVARPDPAAAPLVTASAARLLVATALATFPNTALIDPATVDRPEGSPATLRLAVAFIHENAHQDITLADIASAAHVTIRAVQLAFRRHLDITPRGYLRQVRLGHAHRELQAAGPESDTITAIAGRWGFASSSRFAAYYREAYGVLPSWTLRG